VRQAALHAGIGDRVSPHWLRHAHPSHALDHGAPIHLVQATLGHNSVATMSRYLHARPGDSSARFLALESISSESSRIALPVAATGAMNVVTAATAAKGERQKMSTNIAESQESARATEVAQEPKASKKANARAQKPRVAPGKGKRGTRPPLPRKPPTGESGLLNTAQASIILNEKGEPLAWPPGHQPESRINWLNLDIERESS
jgi:hypothetical protein